MCKKIKIKISAVISIQKLFDVLKKKYYFFSKIRLVDSNSGYVKVKYYKIRQKL